MDENNKKLYMVVNIEQTKKQNKQYPGFAWVAFAGLQNRRFYKRWIDLSKNEQIKCGMIGEFDKNDEFHGVQECFDLKQQYCVGQVMSVEKSLFLKRPVYKYHVGLVNGDFDTSFVESSEQLAIEGNSLLLYYEKYIMNLTVMENCWNLWHHYNVRKYGLRPSYSGLMANKHCFAPDVKEYKNQKDELVMPAVISEYGGGISFSFFSPHAINGNYWHNVRIAIEGIYRPFPRPSDIVLLEQTEEENKFILADNLTMTAQLRNMQNKFGLPQHQAEMAEYYKECFGGERE